MKKQVFALTLFFCCLIGFAKDKNPINYRFNKNDTIYLLKEVEKDGKKVSTKLQIVVQEAKKTTALLKFNQIGSSFEADSTLIDQSTKDGLDKFIEQIKSKSISPIIQFKNGKPKNIVNFKEVKAYSSEMVDNLFKVLSTRTENLPDSLKEKADSTALLLERFLKPMFEMFMTEDVFMSEYSDIVISDLPQKFEKISYDDGKNFFHYSLTATENEGEYAFQKVEKTELGREDLNDPEQKGDLTIDIIKEMGALGKLVTAFLDSYKIEETSSGIIYSNGIPKQLVREKKTTISAMGRNKENIEKITISAIDK